MGVVAVKRIDNNYDSDKAVENLIKYVIREKDSAEKVRYWGTRGLLKNVNYAIETIITMQRYLNKNKGRRMYHIVVSLPSCIKDEQVTYILADVLADYFGRRYQLGYGVHFNTDNYHIHIAMNSINYKTGKKWHKSKKEFATWCDDLKDISESILREYNAIFKILRSSPSSLFLCTISGSVPKMSPSSSLLPS